MKKFLAAITLVVLLGSCAPAAPIDGIWNMRFGMPRDVVASIMTEKNGGVRVTDYTYQPNTAESLYLVNFFGREGTLLLRFVKGGLRLARFSFDRKENKAPAAPPAPAPEPKPEGPKIIDARTAAPAEGMADVPPSPNPEVHVLPPSTNFLHLKSMLTKKYGVPTNEVKYDADVFGYEWKPAKGQYILLYEDRFTPGSQAVLTYEDANIR